MRTRRPAFLAFAVPALLGAGACTSIRETSPPRTATEQLLNTTAAERAAGNLELALPPGARVFVDAANFEGMDARYAVGAVRERLLKLGARLVQSRAQAEVVVEIRAGALSIDESSMLIGMPQFGAPVPFAGTLILPEVPLFREHERRGVSRIAAVAIRAEDGTLLDAARAQGTSRRTDYTFLLTLTWTTSDLPKP